MRVFDILFQAFHHGEDFRVHAHRIRIPLNIQPAARHFRGEFPEFAGFLAELAQGIAHDDHIDPHGHDNRNGDKRKHGKAGSIVGGGSRRAGAFRAGGGHFGHHG